MFSNTINGLRADLRVIPHIARPAYKTMRSAGTAWLDTSRKYVSRKMHKAADALDVHPAR